MRKLLLTIAGTALALTGAGCGSQADQSSATTTTTVRAATAGAVALAPSVSAPPGRSIVGAWSGHLTPPPGSHKPRQRFTIVIASGERRGSWRTGPTCTGTLRLKDISDGYHHYYRIPGAHPGCAARGIDCLKRSGAEMVDVFVPNAGGGNFDGTFRRIR